MYFLNAIKNIPWVNFAPRPFTFSVDLKKYSSASSGCGGRYQLLGVEDPCEIYVEQNSQKNLEVLSLSALDIGALEEQQGEVSGVIWAALVMGIVRDWRDTMSPAFNYTSNVLQPTVKWRKRGGTIQGASSDPSKLLGTK